MADIELVIKIPEEVYEMIMLKINTSVVAKSCSEAEKIIAKGTPLPKGHGDIGDFDEALKCIEETSDCDIKVYAIGLIEWAMKKRVIIKADKESEE